MKWVNPGFTIADYFYDIDYQESGESDLPSAKTTEREPAEKRKEKTRRQFRVARERSKFREEKLHSITIISIATIIRTDLSPRREINSNKIFIILII